MKKTKAEKRLADLRRTLELERKKDSLYYQETVNNQQIAISSTPTRDSVAVTKNREQAVGELHPQNQSIYIYPIHFIRRDLTKTLILCILAISLELGLFIALEKPGLLPF